MGFYKQKKPWAGYRLRANNIKHSTCPDCHSKIDAVELG
jgi:uncharacterized protein YlaI